VTTSVIHRGTCAYLVSWDCGETWQSCDAAAVEHLCGQAVVTLLRNHRLLEATAHTGARFRRRDIFTEDTP